VPRPARMFAAGRSGCDPDEFISPRLGCRTGSCSACCDLARICFFCRDSLPRNKYFAGVCPELKLAKTLLQHKPSAGCRSLRLLRKPLEADVMFQQNLQARNSLRWSAPSLPVFAASETCRNGIVGAYSARDGPCHHTRACAERSAHRGHGGLQVGRDRCEPISPLRIARTRQPWRSTSAPAPTVSALSAASPGKMSPLGAARQVWPFPPLGRLASLRAYSSQLLKRGPKKNLVHVHLVGPVIANTTVRAKWLLFSSLRVCVLCYLRCAGRCVRCRSAVNHSLRAFRLPMSLHRDLRSRAFDGA